MAEFELSTEGLDKDLVADVVDHGVGLWRGGARGDDRGIASSASWGV
jgi:hypothetical protein